MSDKTTVFDIPTVGSCVLAHEHDKYSQSEPTEGYALPPFTMKPTNQETGKCYYGVRIVTGQLDGAGTADTGVFVNLIGSKGQSGKIYLMSWLTALSGAVKKSTYDDLIVESKGDLGDILVVVLGNDTSWVSALMGAPWYVDCVTVCNFQTSTPHNQQEFPCYHWIGDGSSVSFTASTMTLKDVSEDKVLLQQRRDQLALRQSQYVWMKNLVEMPACINDTSGEVPDDEKLSRVKTVHLSKTGRNAVIKLKLEGLFITVDNIHDFEELTDSLGDLKTPLYQASRWTSDEEFGRQVLNGVNPILVERCTSLPSNFNVTNDMVKNLLCRGLSLEEEMKAGHMYILNFKLMDGLPVREGCYFTAPICLLYVKPTGQLVPIAIQLKQGLRDEEKNEPNPVFLPTDGWIDWLLAKTYCQNANMLFHQLVTHFMSCHAVMEVYSVATWRNLPDPHPIYKLLSAHLRYTISINVRARLSLINQGGVADTIFGIGEQGKIELFGRGYDAYSIHWSNIKRSAKQRGVDDAKLLPGYYYRDDGFKLWDAVEEYVRSIVDAFYTCDDDVKKDVELQNWAGDIHTNGFPTFREARLGHDFPKEITTKDELVEYCTLIIFTGSAHHATVNNGQFFILGFVPNAPCAMLRPPPSEKGKATYKTLIDSLPDKATAVIQSAVSLALSEYSKEEIFLGNFPARRFTEKKAEDAIQQFKERLGAISTEIHERNKGLDIPYIYMLPEQISNSITV